MNAIVRVLCTRYLDINKKPTIGGVQSYVESLCEYLVEDGYHTIVYQFSSQEFFNITRNSYTVKGIKKAKSTKDLLNYIYSSENPDYNKDILVFSTDFMIVPNKFKKSIAIQHGVAWDITTDNKVSDFGNFLSIFKGALRACKKYQKYKSCKNIVCVDYNFVNWYRTQVNHISNNLFVVPNYTKIYNNTRHKTCTVPSIVFARRLVDYRGTKLFANAIAEVLKMYPGTSITVAGTGPDEKWMKKYLHEYSEVNFTQYSADESVKFHENFDIAIVPTKGAEGTSLSLLEAMSAGCAVIATNIGGMTNIIINDYNGKLIFPKHKELVDAIVELIDNAEKRAILAKRGNEMAREAFSIDRWKKAWREVIQFVQSSN